MEKFDKITEQKQNNKAIALESFKTVLKEFRNKFNIDLCLRLNDFSAELICMNENGKSIFGADIDFTNKYPNQKDKRRIEMNYGSMGSFNPNIIDGSTILTHLIAETLKHWDEIEKILTKAFDTELLIREEYMKLNRV